MRGYRTIKYTLFIFCYFFWVSGNNVVDTLTADPALLLIIIGSIMFLITFLGCFGALRNATCLLKTFLGTLTAILVVQVAADTRLIVSVVQVMERTERLMMNTILSYREDPDLENAIDFVQKKFQCCGVESYKDWGHNIYFNCSDTNPSLEACGVPFSCCVGLQNQTVLNTMCGYGVQQLDWSSAAEEVFTVGCLEKIASWTKNNLLLVAALTGGLLLLEVTNTSVGGVSVYPLMTSFNTLLLSAGRDDVSGCGSDLQN
uniref:Tetraspanin n=1 Tax=Labrus bergylta TaxID=56723 RepID=A0A3Q3G7W7_9LABR